MRFLASFFLILNFVFGIELMKLGEYIDQNVSGWLVSEKLDGIRAYWDGKKLISRNSKQINAPAWFLADFPSFELDGELFTRRGEFEKIQSIVMDQIPDDTMWRSVKFYVFDVPNATGGLLDRLSRLDNFLHEKPNENIAIITQTTISNKNDLMEFYNKVISNGGEGVVIREPSAPYLATRSGLNLKFKLFKDAECVVVALNSGKGKFAGLLGSVTCEMENKVRFKIGSGFTHWQRKNPPKIGEIITFKYQNLTKKGKPRFPVFLRIRKD